MAISFTAARRMVLAALVALSVCVGGLAPASAHDELLKAVPAAGATVKESPKEVSLTFSGNLTTGQGIPNVIKVLDHNGTDWAAGDAVVDGRVISVKVKPGMPDGEYKVAFRVVYSDGHPEEKSYTFTLDAGQSGDSGAGAGASSSPSESAGASAPATTAGGQSSQPPAAGPGTQDQAQQQTDAGPSPLLFVLIGVLALCVIALAVFMARKSRKPQSEVHRGDGDEGLEA